MAEYCKKCWLALNKDVRAADVVESSYSDYCERCGKYGKVRLGDCDYKAHRETDYYGHPYFF